MGACGYMMADYHQAIAREITLRWTEDSEEFEEDIVPTEFCAKVGICKEGHKSINEMISQSDRREKDLKWEKEQKEKSAKSKKKKVKSFSDDGDEEDEPNPKQVP